MKSLIILTLAFAVVSCGRTNPQKKINEETKKAVDALKVEQKKEMSALKENDAKALQAEVESHKKDNAKSKQILTEEERELAMYKGALGSQNTTVKSLILEKRNLVKDLKSQAALAASAKASLETANAKIEELKKQLADASKQEVALEVEPTEEVAEAVVDESKILELSKQVESLKEELDQSRNIKNFYIVSPDSSPSEFLGNPGDCFKAVMGEDSQKWIKSEESLWEEVLEDDAEMVAKFEQSCSDLQKVELTNNDGTSSKIALELEPLQEDLDECISEYDESECEEEEEVQPQRPVIISSQLSTTLNN